MTSDSHNTRLGGVKQELQDLKTFADFKGCVRYIFASFFFRCKREHLSNYEKCFLLHFKSSFHS